MKYLIYLHGFNSSPQSEKAQLTAEYFRNYSANREDTKQKAYSGYCHDHVDVFVPALPPAPLDAMAAIHALVAQHGRENLLGFIGSSLGGYYALYLKEFYSTKGNILKAVLINPAIRPYDLLAGYLGENQNMYTGERYIVEPSHMDDLKSLAVESMAKPDHVMVLTQTGDEVLNYQEAVTCLNGAAMWIQYGGSHAFDHYPAVLPCILGFCLKL